MVSSEISANLHCNFLGLPGYGGPTAILAANAAPELFSALAALAIPDLLVSIATSGT